MIAGLGPVLGDGVLGYFIDPTGFEVAWRYNDGVSSSGGTPIERVPTPYRLRREQPKVAVLTDNAVARLGRGHRDRVSRASKHPLVRTSDVRPVDSQ